MFACGEIPIFRKWSSFLDHSYNSGEYVGMNSLSEFYIGARCYLLEDVIESGMSPCKAQKNKGRIFNFRSMRLSAVCLVMWCTTQQNHFIWDNHSHLPHTWMYTHTQPCHTHHKHTQAATHTPACTRCCSCDPTCTTVHRHLEVCNVTAVTLAYTHTHTLVGLVVVVGVVSKFQWPS